MNVFSLNYSAFPIFVCGLLCALVSGSFFFFLVVYGRVFVASLLFPFLFSPNGHLSCFANVGAKETCPVGSRGKMIEDAKARKKKKKKTLGA